MNEWRELGSQIQGASEDLIELDQEIIRLERILDAQKAL